MRYEIFSQDVSNSLRKHPKARPTHLEHAQQLIKEGLLAGPGGSLPAMISPVDGESSMADSMNVAVLGSFGATNAWTDDDLSVHASVYKSVTAKPFIQILP